LPNQFTQKNKFNSLEMSDILPAIAIFKFVIPSWIFHQFDNKYIQNLLKILLLIYIFIPLLNQHISTEYININSHYFITNYFYSIIDKNSYSMLITLYLLAPLITLYFKEHGLIIDDFVSNYNKIDNKNEENKDSLLDLDRDRYDLESLNCHMSKILTNERSLKEYYPANKYILWAKIIGEKRRNSAGDTRFKILIVVSLLILGMPMSLTNHESLYYMFSLSIFIFIMIIIITQIIYSSRSILKLSLLKSATDAAYYYYDKDKNKSEPFTS
jgi:hypothetical protein